MKRLQLAIMCLTLTANAEAQTVYSVGNGVTEPIVTRRVDPQYTTEAKRARIEGTVVLQVVIGPDGAIRDAAVVRSLDSLLGLDQQAVKAMRQWRYKPASKDGKPVTVKVQTEMSFVLK